MTTGKRNRDSVALTSESIVSIRHELRKNGWQQKAWARRGHVSISTVRRLLKGNAISVCGFQTLIKALGLEISELHIASKDNNTKPTHPMKLTPLDTYTNIDDKSQLSHMGLIMTAIFDEDKRMDMELAIRHLRTLLIDSNNSDFSFKECEGSIVVTGKFSKENRSHIDLAISHIDSLSNCKVTEMLC